MQNYNEFIKARKLLNTNKSWLAYVHYYVLKDMVSQTGLPPEGLDRTEPTFTVSDLLTNSLTKFLVAGEHDGDVLDIIADYDIVDESFFDLNTEFKDSLSPAYYEHVKTHNLLPTDESWVTYLYEVAFKDVIKKAGPMPDATDSESIEMLNPIIGEIDLHYHGVRYASENDINDLDADLSFSWYTTPMNELVELDIEEAA